MPRQQLPDPAPTRYGGRQPFVDELARQGRMVSTTAVLLDFDKEYVRRVAQGRVPPVPEFVAALRGLLKRPPEELFTPESLAAEYHWTHASRVFGSGRP